ncbi:MAG: thiamine-phosphate kinase [Mycobacterium sp.]|nr:thiamine-phosphate kinase [Mycobacterium sp.]
MTGAPGGQSEASLQQVGEFALIDRLVRGRRQSADVAVGPGDDAAVLNAADGRVAVSTDMLVEGSHFRRDWSTPNEVGRRAIAQNAADIEAMGARVTGFVVAFGAPPETPAAEVVDLADGMWSEAARVGAGVVGGDLVASPQWVVSVTAFGDLQARQPVLRSGARAGSLIAVAGDLGRSAAGLALLRNEIGQAGDGFEDLRACHRVPRPPYGQGRAAAEAGAQAMTDVSDGLLADLGHVAAASGVMIDLRGATLRTDVDAVADAAAAAGVDPWSLVLAGGEDHALVACFPDYPPHGWRVIGSVRPGAPGVLLDGQGWSGQTGWQSYG